jgi:hypothetical protein
VAYWWLERTLPGIVASAIWAVVLWVSHRRLWRHIIHVTEQQNQHIDRLTAEQTAALTGARIPVADRADTQGGDAVALFEHKPHPWREERKQSGPVKVADQHPRGNVLLRFNARAAVIITKAVGSMWCAYAFALFDLLSLPVAIRGGTATLVSWVAQTFLQLVLLSVIMVGQDVQASAADKRSEQTYRDAEAVLHESEQIQQHLAAQDERLAAQDAALAALATMLTQRATGGTAQ